jgi:hypothetical protein
MAFELLAVHPQGDVVVTPKTRAGRGYRGYSVGRKPDLRQALRAAVTELLGDSPAPIHILRNGRRVAICERQYRQIGKRGGKFSVVCTGQKPPKRRR